MTDDIIPIEEARRHKSKKARVELGDYTNESKDDTIDRLSRLDPIEYDRARADAADRAPPGPPEPPLDSG